MLSKKGLGFWCLVLKRKFLWKEKIVENKTVLLVKKGFYIKVCLWNNAAFESVAI